MLRILEEGIQSASILLDRVGNEQDPTLVITAFRSSDLIAYHLIPPTGSRFRPFRTFGTGSVLWRELETAVRESGSTWRTISGELKSMGMDAKSSYPLSGLVGIWPQIASRVFPQERTIVQFYSPRNGDWAEIIVNRIDAILNELKEVAFAPSSGSPGNDLETFGRSGKLLALVGWPMNSDPIAVREALREMLQLDSEGLSRGLFVPTCPSVTDVLWHKQYVSAADAEIWMEIISLRIRVMEVALLPEFYECVRDIFEDAPFGVESPFLGELIPGCAREFVSQQFAGRLFELGKRLESAFPQLSRPISQRSAHL